MACATTFESSCVQGVEIQAAAERLAKHLGVKLLTTNSGLLWQFHNEIIMSARKEVVSHQVLKLCC